ncbi:17267_t:CDS:2, partial [Dentiscutata heterogama]
SSTSNTIVMPYNSRLCIWSDLQSSKPNRSRSVIGINELITATNLFKECSAYLEFTAEDTSIFTPAEVEIRKNNLIETRTKKWKVEKQDKSSEEDDEDEGYENLNLNNLREGEAWWNLDSNDDLAVEEYKEIANLFDFYFDKEENLVAIYNVKTLPKDQEEKIEVILDKNPDLFAKSISELEKEFLKEELKMMEKEGVI